MSYPVFVLLLLGAGPPTQEQAAAPEDFQRWQFAVPLQLPADSAGKLVGAVLTPGVYGGLARPQWRRDSDDLAEMRLADSSGNALPYALRRLDGKTERHERAGREFDRVTLPDDSERVTLDFGEGRPEHNELRLDVGARSYGRGVTLEGSDDGKEFNRLFEGELVYLTVGSQTIDRRTFSYPPSRARFLRVTLRPDRVEKKSEKQVLNAASVGYYEERPGKWAGGRVSEASRSPVRAMGDAALAWEVRLPDDNTPVSRLTLRVRQDSFDRPYQIELPREEGFSQHVASGRLRPAGDKGEVTVSFPETQASRLRLVVIDSRNSPLDLEVAGYDAVARMLVFRAPADGRAVLYVGNPEAPAPNYEFPGLPAALAELPEATFGSRTENPMYVPPPPPTVAWTERNRWLLDGALVVSLLVLGVLLWRLAAGGIRRHDEAAWANPSA